MLVNGGGEGLDDDHVFAFQLFFDPNALFTVGEVANLNVADLQLKELGELARELRVGGATEDDGWWGSFFGFRHKCG